MEELVDKGLPLELATQALAATGAKSTLKATDWILNQGLKMGPRQQSKMDQFFQGNASCSGLGDVSPEGHGEVEECAARMNFEGRRNAKEKAGVRAGERGYQSSNLQVSCTRVESGQIAGSSGVLKRTLSCGTLENSVPKKQRQDEQETQGRESPSPFYPRKSAAGRFLAPLAERMRPKSIDEVVGQDHVLGPRSILRAMLENDSVPSIILWGPPGTGKTSLAKVIARSVNCKFVSLSAVNSGAKEVREVLDEAGKSKQFGKRTVLFIDELHRFNKAQQDLFLPAVESGQIVFMGATTENPSFEINAALLSRCHLLTLNKLQPEHLRIVLEKALADEDRGVAVSLPGMVSNADFVIRIEEEALNFLAGAADGDARVALNAIEMATTAAYSEEKVWKKAQALDAVAMNPTTSNTRGGSGFDRVSCLSTGLGGQKETQSFVADKNSNCFGLKRLEALKESAKENSHSKEDYTKPIKRFVGGKEVMHVNSKRFERDISDRVRDAVLSVREKGESWVCQDEELKGDYQDEIPSDEDHLDMNSSGVVVTVTLSQVRDAFQRAHIVYDKSGEEHYNIISALHKSMRGGDPDAAIYWLARMLEGGEGPLYVARRLIRFASEDVGLADPLAMGIAVSCYQACHFLGMPECNVNLAQCVVYLSLAPKSVVVYQAIESAQKLVRETQHNESVPLYLRNAPTRFMKEMGYGKGYIYPPGWTGRIEQEYLPPSLHGHKFLNWPESYGNQDL